MWLRHELPVQRMRTLGFLLIVRVKRLAVQGRRKTGFLQNGDAASVTSL
jgi:hypothetical protein